MNNTLSRILVVTLLMAFVLAPFAGLAPLMFILLIAGVTWSLSSIIQSFFLKDEEDKTHSSP